MNNMQYLLEKIRSRSTLLNLVTSCKQHLNVFFHNYLRNVGTLELPYFICEKSFDHDVQRESLNALYIIYQFPMFCNEFIYISPVKIGPAEDGSSQCSNRLRLTRVMRSSPVTHPYTETWRLLLTKHDDLHQNHICY